MRTKEELIEQIELCQETVSFLELKLSKVIVEIDKLESQPFPDEKEYYEAFDNLGTLFARIRVEGEMLDSLEREFRKGVIYKKGFFSKTIDHNG